MASQPRFGVAVVEEEPVAARDQSGGACAVGASEHRRQERIGAGLPDDLDNDPADQLGQRLSPFVGRG